MRVLKALVRLLAVVVVAGVGTAAVAVAAAPQIAKLLTAHDSTSSRPPLRTLSQQSFVYDRNDNPIAELKGDVNRTIVRLDQVPVGVRDAFIAVEDEGFYNHKGVSFSSLVRATLSNVSAGEVRQGGSTITQQVVKNLILTDSQTADRKITEAMYALRLEKEMTKDQILEQYLNMVYLGNGAYGVQAGAEVYFNKNVGDLTIEEGAFLAGLIRNPTQYDPFRYPDRSKARWRTSLRRLVEVERLTDAQYEAATLLELPAAASRRALPPETYFVETVKQALLDGAIPNVLGNTDEERARNLFYGGYKIYTTFDPDLQRMAEEAYNEVLPPQSERGDTDAAIVAIEPTSGAVRAMVGGPGFDDWQFNLAVQGNRQPGSSFKTFVLVAALEAGVLPEDRIDGVNPCNFPNPGGEPDPYVVNAAGNGINTIASMTAKSTNCAYVRLGQIVGLQRVIQTAQKMGINSAIFNDPKAPSILSMPLGTLEVSPVDMASAYGVLAAEGAKHTRHYVTKIVDANGTVVYDRGTPPPEQVISRDTALRATQTLEGVITGGTGRTNARLADGRPAAGKTGTAEDNGDAWFVGYTPQLVTAVWVGHKQDRFKVTLPGFGNVQGGNAPAKLWSTFMNKALAGQQVMDFPDPPPPPRAAARVYLPGGECGAVIADEDVPWTTEEVSGGRGRRDRIVYHAATELNAPVPSVAGGGGIYDCLRGPPTTPPSTVPGETLPDGSPAPTAPPDAAPPQPDGTPPSSEQTGGDNG